MSSWHQQPTPRRTPPASLAAVVRESYPTADEVLRERYGTLAELIEEQHRPTPRLRPPATRNGGTT